MPHHVASHHATWDHSMAHHTTWHLHTAQGRCFCRVLYPLMPNVPTAIPHAQPRGPMSPCSSPGWHWSGWPCEGSSFEKLVLGSGMFPTLQGFLPLSSLALEVPQPMVIGDFEGSGDT